MAQKVQVVLTCDLDEDDVPAVETVTFGYDGYNYSFELCESHLEEFHSTMQGYISAARYADGPRRRRGSAGLQPSTGRRGRVDGRPSREDLGAIRAWARDAGYQVSDRGRISSEIRSAYEEAQA